MKALNQPLTVRTAGLYLSVLLGVAAVGWASWRGYARITNRPPSTAEVHRSIWDFLEKKTRDAEFHTELAAASVTNVLEPVAFTNKAGVVKTSQRVKRGAFGLPETSVSVFFRTNQADASTYEQIYRVIGQQLRLSEQLLASEDSLQKQSGLVLAIEASAYARNDAVNPWLASRICEGYLWPNLPALEGATKASFSIDALLGICDATFREADETNSLVRNYELWIAKASKPQQADSLRFRLARTYGDLGEEEKALGVLKEIKTIKNPRLDQQIAALEQKVRSSKN